MPTGNEIITTYNLDRLGFIGLVQDGNLTALWDLEPINWQDEEVAFINCQQLIKISIRINQEAGYWRSNTAKVYDIERAISHSHEPVALWSVLAKKLTGARSRVNIEPTQFRILSEGKWGPVALEVVALKADYKEDDTLCLCNFEAQPSSKISNDDISVSTKETWLKIILLLSYSLAIELKGDEKDNLLNKKGRNRINPDKLASWLKKQAHEMFPDNDNPAYRLGSTTIEKILKEAEEKLSPDIHAFLSPQK